MSNFFKRWSDLKQTRAKSQTVEIPTEINELPSEDIQDKPLTQSEELSSSVENTGLTLEDVAQLKPDSDFSKFVNAEVGDEVHHAAMKKLFSDPHYNIMDGLDIYIDDYSKEDPLPAGMLEKMVQSSMLGLFNKVEEKIEEKIPEIISIEQPNTLEVNEETSQVTPVTGSGDLEQNQEEPTPLTKGSTDDPDTRL